MTRKKRIQEIAAVALGILIFLMITVTVYVLAKGSESASRQEAVLSTEKVREMNLASNREGNQGTLPAPEGVMVTAVPEVMEFSKAGQKGQETTEPSPEAAEEPAAEESFCFPASDTTFITEEEAAALSPEQAQLAINEILARRGRRFQEPELQAYFDSQSWYMGTIAPEVFDANRTLYLNEVEIYNVNLLSTYR